METVSYQVGEDDVRTIRGIYEGYNRKDANSGFEAFDPKISVYQTDLLPWGGDHHGHEELRDLFSKIAENVDSHVTIDEYIVAGDRIVAVGRSQGHIKANKREFDVSIVHVWTMRNGKAIRWEAYIDTPKMLNALQNID